MFSIDDYYEQTDEWEYCYCRKCDRIKSILEIDVTEYGIMCKKCKGYEIDAPGWVYCPHHKVRAVKCPRAGKGIKKLKYGYVCQDRCHFRFF